MTIMEWEFFDINFDNRDTSDDDFQRGSVQKEIDVEIQRYDNLKLKHQT